MPAIGGSGLEFPTNPHGTVAGGMDGGVSCSGYKKCKLLLIRLYGRSRMLDFVGKIAGTIGVWHCKRYISGILIRPEDKTNRGPPRNYRLSKFYADTTRLNSCYQLVIWSSFSYRSVYSLVWLSNNEPCNSESWWYHDVKRNSYYYSFATESPSDQWNIHAGGQRHRAS